MELYPGNLGNAKISGCGIPEETCYGFSFALFHPNVPSLHTKAYIVSNVVLV